MIEALIAIWMSKYHMACHRHRQRTHSQWYACYYGSVGFVFGLNPVYWDSGDVTNTNDHFRLIEIASASASSSVASHGNYRDNLTNDLC